MIKKLYIDITISRDFNLLSNGKISILTSENPLICSNCMRLEDIMSNGIFSCNGKFLIYSNRLFNSTPFSLLVHNITADVPLKICFTFISSGPIPCRVRTQKVIFLFSLTVVYKLRILLLRRKKRIHL